MQYAIVITALPRNYSAYVPDLPGCIATGKTLQQVRQNIREAMEMHLESMVSDGDPLPEHDSFGETVSLSIAAQAAD